LLADKALFYCAVTGAAIMIEVIKIIALLSVLADPIATLICAYSTLQGVSKDTGRANGRCRAAEAFRGTPLTIVSCLIVIVADGTIHSRTLWQLTFTNVLEKEVPWITCLASKRVFALSTIGFTVRAETTWKSKFT